MYVFKLAPSECKAPLQLCLDAHFPTESSNILSNLQQETNTMSTLEVFRENLQNYFIDFNRYDSFFFPFCFPIVCSTVWYCLIGGQTTQQVILRDYKLKATGNKLAQSRISLCSRESLPEDIV